MSSLNRIALVPTTKTYRIGNLFTHKTPISDRFLCGVMYPASRGFSTASPPLACTLSFACLVNRIGFYVTLPSIA